MLYCPLNNQEFDPKKVCFRTKSEIANTPTLSSIFSGFKDAHLDVTVFSATENKLPDFELTAGNGKTTLAFKLLLSAIN